MKKGRKFEKQRPGPDSWCDFTHKTVELVSVVCITPYHPISNAVMPKHNGLKCYGDSSEIGKDCNSGDNTFPVCKTKYRVFQVEFFF